MYSHLYSERLLLSGPGRRVHAVRGLGRQIRRRPVSETMRADDARAALLLRSQYPGYRFTSLLRPEGWSHTAQAKHLGTRPWCVVTSDPADFHRELAAPTARRP